MPDLTARFSIADQMSSSLEQISQAGMNMVPRQTPPLTESEAELHPPYPL